MNFLDNYISLKYFIISFCIGIFMVYISTPLPEIIIRYPTPLNSGKVIYKDIADLCYVYDKKEVNCSSKDIIDTPIQISKNKEKNNTGAIHNIYNKQK